MASPIRHWWQEGFRAASTHLHFRDGEGLFVAEESTASFSPVYEASVSVVQQVIGQCYAFEYYLAPKNLAWLLGENHSDVVFARGEPGATTLPTLATQDGKTL